MRWDGCLLKQVHRLDTELPPFVGEQISLEIQARLSAYRGRLFSCTDRGTPVYAASFIRCRSIVVESALLRKPRLLRAILVHELAHFVWTRLGNLAREEFSALLREERLRGARGELGESAAVYKAALSESAVIKNSKQWRDYVCESFCDTTSAFFGSRALYLGPRLAQRFVQRRQKWFTEHLRDYWRL